MTKLCGLGKRISLPHLEHIPVPLPPPVEPLDLACPVLQGQGHRAGSFRPALPGLVAWGSRTFTLSWGWEPAELLGLLAPPCRDHRCGEIRMPRRTGTFRRSLGRLCLGGSQAPERWATAGPRGCISGANPGSPSSSACTTLEIKEVPTPQLQVTSTTPKGRWFGSALPSPRCPCWVQFRGRKGVAQSRDIQSE